MCKNLRVAKIDHERLEYEHAVAQLEQANAWINLERRNRGMDFYEPNANQLRAHKSLARTILFCGGNRSGKSTFGAIELCYHLTRQYPVWYPEAKRYKHPIKAVVSATEYPVVTRVIEPKIAQYLPRGYYKMQRTMGKYLSRIVCQDGSTVDILTSEMKDEAYESADWDFAWMDEPQQKRKRDAILRGLVDRRGLEVITFTPLTEPWMKDDLVDRADGRMIDLIQADIRDNKFTISGEPILSEEAIKEFEASISEEYRETRMHGVFFTMRGIIYKEFSEAHTPSCDHETFNADDCPHHYHYPDPVICVLDPHDRQPHHLVWAYIDRDDDIHVDYELVVRCELDDLAKKIKTVEKERGYKMRKRLIDPNFGRKPARAGANYSVMQELARHGAGFYEPCDDIELGHMIVRDYLHCDFSKPITATNKPKLFISRQRAPITVRSMRNYQYQEWQGKTKDDRDPKEMNKDKDTHGADCVRYLCIGKPTYGRLTESKEYELEEAVY